MITYIIETMMSVMSIGIILWLLSDLLKHLFLKGYNELGKTPETIPEEKLIERFEDNGYQYDRARRVFYNPVCDKFLTLDGARLEEATDNIISKPLRAMEEEFNAVVKSNGR